MPGEPNGTPVDQAKLAKLRQVEFEFEAASDRVADLAEQINDLRVELGYVAREDLGPVLTAAQEKCDHGSITDDGYCPTCGADFSLPERKELYGRA